VADDSGVIAIAEQNATKVLELTQHIQAKEALVEQPIYDRLSQH
jgi:regulator of RNase E activity RraA